MRHFKWLAIVLAVIVGIGCTPVGGNGTALAAQENPQWDQSVIDSAVNAGLSLVNSGSKNGGAGFGVDKDWRGTCLIASEVMAFLAQVAYYEPDRKASNGKTVSNRLVEHINNITSPDDLNNPNAAGSYKAPACRGGLGGWVDGPVAQSLALAKNNPSVWNKLSKDVQNRCDFIMKVMALTGNYTQNYRNNPCSDMSQITWWNKGWNPNHQEGYVGVMIAAYYYFGGADEVNAILTEFDYESYIQQMKDYNYSIMRGYYEKAGKKLLEEGGVDGPNEKGETGTLVGVKIPFTYCGVDENGRDVEVPYDPIQLYTSLARSMYGKTVISTVYSNGTLRGYINKKDSSGNYIKSPFDGLMGMGTEFLSNDANGIRTDAGYINSGWRNSVPTRATIEILGGWRGESIIETASRMYVGSEDFLFKTDPANGGYVGYQKGHPTAAIVQSDFDSHGFMYYKQTWDKLLKDDMDFNARFSKSGNTITAKLDAYNLAITEDRMATVVMAVYDGERLTGIDSKSIKINKLTTGKQLLELSLPVSGTNPSVQLFIWDSLDRMQPLTEPFSFAL